MKMIAPSLPAKADRPGPVDDVSVLGYPVTNLTLDEAVARFATFLEESGLHHIVVANTNKIWLANRTPELGKILHRAEMVVTEYGPVWASRVMGTPLKANIRGIGLLRALLPMLEQCGAPIYLLGGHEEVLRTLLSNLQLTHPQLAIAGARNGYFQAADEFKIVDDINKSGAAVLFVAMGSPRQELFVERYRSALRIRAAMGVGGSFDVLAGLKRDAPSWTRHGTEWAYRLLQDPKNLWKRYLRAHSWFIYRTLRDKAFRTVPSNSRRAADQ